MHDHFMFFCSKVRLANNLTSCVHKRAETAEIDRNTNSKKSLLCGSQSLQETCIDREKGNDLDFVLVDWRATITVEEQI